MYQWQGHDSGEVVGHTTRDSRRLVSTLFCRKFPEVTVVSFPFPQVKQALSYIGSLNISRLEVVEDIDIPDFEETVDEFRVFQARESRKDLAREERNRRRKTIMDLERPDFCGRRLTLEKLDSAVVVD